MAAEGPLAKVERVIEELAPMFAAEVDIHTYTRQIGRACQQVLSIEREYALTAPASLETVVAEILDYCNHDPNVQRVLQSIQRQGAHIEAETGLHIPSLLISTWALAKTVPYANAEDLIIDNLRHNIATGGGCDAGISARLVLPYLHFLKAQLQQRLNPHQNIYVPQDDELERALTASYDLFNNRQQSLADEELQRALAISLSTPMPEPPHHDDDLEAALAMSLSMPMQPGLEDELSLAFALALSKQSDGYSSRNEVLQNNQDEDLDDPELQEALRMSRYFR